MVGLDLGSSVVKAVEITLEGQEPVITGFSRAELPPGGSIDDAVKQVFKEGRFRSKRVVSGVSGQDTVVRYLSMPAMSDSELQQAIQLEADKIVAILMTTATTTPTTPTTPTTRRPLPLQGVNTGSHYYYYYYY